MYQYPYGNSQQLNLDWLLTAWRQFQKAVEDMIAPQFSDTETYTAHSVVIYEHALYTNPAAITAPSEWNPDSWEVTSVAELMAE